MAFRVKFVTGEESEFDGTVGNLNMSARTTVAGMVALKAPDEGKSIYVNLEHIVYAQDV